MGLKAGWLALFVFVWVIGSYLGSTFDYQNTVVATGTSYSTGTATFTQGSATVTGAGTAWVHATMAGGIIKANNDGVWYKIFSVTNPTTIVLTAVYAEAGGAGLNYTIQASEGWAGSGGTASYEISPLQKLQDLVNTNMSTQRNGVIGVFKVITSSTFWDSVVQIVTWQWSFLKNADGTWAYGMFYWIFIFPFVVMGILSLLLLAYGIVTGNITWG